MTGMTNECWLFSSPHATLPVSAGTHRADPSASPGRGLPAVFLSRLSTSNLDVSSRHGPICVFGAARGCRRMQDEGALEMTDASGSRVTALDTVPVLVAIRSCDRLQSPSLSPFLPSPLFWQGLNARCCKDRGQGQRYFTFSTSVGQAEDLALFWAGIAADRPGRVSKPSSLRKSSPLPNRPRQATTNSPVPWLDPVPSPNPLGRPWPWTARQGSRGA